MQQYIKLATFNLANNKQDVTIKVVNSQEATNPYPQIEGDKISFEYTLDKISLESINALCSKIAADVKAHNSGFNLEIDSSLNAELIIESLLLALSDINIFKSSYTEPQTYDVYMSEQLAASYPSAYSRATAYNLTRTLNHLPHSLCNSQTLSESIVELLDDPRFKITINRLSQCQELEMHGVLALSQGSRYEPAVIRVEYSQGSGKRVGLVGKGVMFDSGGYNIKSGDITSMKTDMAGCGAVIGTLKAISSLDLEVNVVAYLMTTDNLINEQAYIPGDIITYSNGVTVEVGNTDAEGRLILADGLLLMEQENCDVVIDIATLTGNSAVALGKSYSPIFSTNDEVTSIFTSLNETSTDKVWPLPIASEYVEFIKGNISDIRNTSSTKNGGSIIAAVFLHHFAPNTNWVHIDMGAMSRKEEFGAPVNGFGVRLLTNFIETYCTKS